MDPETTPELTDFIIRSIDHWTSFGPTDNGFSIAASTLMNQRVPGRDDASWRELSRAWELKNLGKATFYWESSFCPVNESPFGLAAGLQYMVLRSDVGKLDVFPLHTEALRDVSMWNMRAEGGFLVSGVMKTLETQWVRVESLYGNECIVRVRGFEEVDWEPRTILVHAAGLKRIGGMIIRNATFRIELKRGESVVLHPKGRTPELVVRPQPEDVSTSHAWGLHWCVC